MQTLEILSLNRNSTDVVKAINSKAEKGARRKEKWAYIVGLFAVVFLWRAIWDWSDYYFSTNGSFVIGLILVGIVAWLHKDHVKDLF